MTMSRTDAAPSTSPGSAPLPPEPAELCRPVSDRPVLAWPLQILTGLAVTGILVSLAYFFVDRPVTFFVRDHHLNHYRVLRWLTRPPEAFCLLSPVVFAAGLLRRYFGGWSRWEIVAVAAAVSTLLTASAALILKMSFGRYCPDLWAGDGPSLLHGGVYGFNPFHVGPAYWAFPSGHAACTESVTAVVQAAVPRWGRAWWVANGLAGMVAVVLVALNYHFVGDVIAGVFVGWTIAGGTARWFGICRGEARLSRG